MCMTLNGICCNFAGLELVFGQTWVDSGWCCLATPSLWVVFVSEKALKQVCQRWKRSSCFGSALPWVWSRPVEAVVDWEVKLLNCRFWQGCANVLHVCGGERSSCEGI